MLRMGLRTCKKYDLAILTDTQQNIGISILMQKSVMLALAKVLAEAGGKGKGRDLLALAALASIRAVLAAASCAFLCSSSKRFSSSGSFCVYAIDTLSWYMQLMAVMTWTNEAQVTA